MNTEEAEIAKFNPSPSPYDEKKEPAVALAGQPVSFRSISHGADYCCLKPYPLVMCEVVSTW